MKLTEALRAVPLLTEEEAVNQRQGARGLEGAARSAPCPPQAVLMHTMIVLLIPGH